MKALTLTQPWASLVAMGVKGYETRSWQTSYRGPLAIHAAKTATKADRAVWDQYLVDFARFGFALTWEDLPRGEVIGFTRLIGIRPVEEVRHLIGVRELFLGDYTDGRFAWELGATEPIEPAPARGHLGLWNWPY